MRKRHQIQIALLSSGILAAVVVALLSLPAPVSTLQPSGPSDAYAYYTWTDSSGVNVFVSVTDPMTYPGPDYTAYRAESHERIDAWAADPQAAPALDGHRVVVTFREPMTIPGLHAALPAGWITTTDQGEIYAGVDFNIVAFSLVGRGPGGREESTYTSGPEIRSFDYGTVFEDPNCAQEPDACGPVSYRGVLLLDLELHAGTSHQDLVNVKNHPDVYLVDTTGIALFEDLVGQGHSPETIGDISLPWPMYTATGSVVW